MSIAAPSPLTCPDCGGGLWEMKDARPLRYRCHTGHAYSALSLAHAQQQTAEETLWSSVRALREREMLMRRLASIAAATGDAGQAAAGQAKADQLREQIRQLKAFAERVPPGSEADSAA